MSCVDSTAALPSQACFLCGGTDFEPYQGRAMLCRNCGILINLETQPLDYAEGGGQSPPDAAKMRWRLENARMRLALITPFLRGHQALIDIGCGSGEMLEVGATCFRQCLGFDTNGPLIRHIRDRCFNNDRITVFESHFDGSLLPGNVFSEKKVFLLSHVLEHLSHPQALVNSIAAAMSSGDLLYLEVPLHSGEAFRRLGFEWTLWNHEHLALYSMPALELLATKANLAILHRGTRIFARGSHSNKTRVKLFSRSPLQFLKAALTKGNHSIADLMMADYGCLVLQKI